MTLFEEMVESRRRGEMAVPTDDGAEAAAEVRVDFSLHAPTTLLDCLRCFAVIPEWRRENHWEWHQIIGG